jgi:hypothetical protein
MDAAVAVGYTIKAAPDGSSYCFNDPEGKNDDRALHDTAAAAWEAAIADMELVT